MWIMVAGPYRSGTVDPVVRSANLHKLNEAAVALFRAGHVPIIGVNMVLPMISAAGGSEADYGELMAPVALALVDRCDCLPADRRAVQGSRRGGEAVRGGQAACLSGARRCAGHPLSEATAVTGGAAGGDAFCNLSCGDVPISLLSIGAKSGGSHQTVLSVVTAVALVSACAAIEYQSDLIRPAATGRPYTAGIGDTVIDPQADAVAAQCLRQGRYLRAHARCRPGDRAAGRTGRQPGHFRAPGRGHPE